MYKKYLPTATTLCAANLCQTIVMHENIVINESQIP